MLNLLDLCEKIVKKVSPAADAEACAEAGKEINVSIESNDLKMCDTSTFASVGLRVIKGKSTGYAFTNSLKKDAIESMIQTALKIAAVTPADEYNVLPTPKKIVPIKRLYDKEWEGFGIDDAISQAALLLKTAKEFDSRVSVDSGGFNATLTESAVVNSYGVECTEKTTRFDYFIMGMAVEGSSVSSFNYQYDGTRFVKEIDVAKVATEFAKIVIKSLGAKRPKGFKGSVLLTPDAVHELIVDSLAFQVDANHVQKGLSLFKNRLGAEVGVEELTVIDDGTLPAGLGSASFDREGMPHKPLKFIKNGVLKSYLYNTYTAAKDGLETTSHAGGDIRDAPAIETTNFIIQPGKESFEDLQSEIKNGIVVTRFSGCPDPVSGDFSGVVKGGWLIENGLQKKPILETTVAGNFFNLLKTITGISKETKKIEESILPYIRVENLSIVSGG